MMFALIGLFAALMVAHWRLMLSKKHRLAAYCAFAKAAIVVGFAFVAAKDAAFSGNGISPVILYVLCGLSAAMNVATGLKSLRLAASETQTPNP